MSQITTLQSLFGELKDDVYESVKTQPPDTFIDRLTLVNVNGQEHHMDYIKEIIDKKMTIAEMWIELNSYWNFLNYEMLQHVLTKFRNDALQERMDQYTTKIRKFFKATRLCNFVKCWPVRGTTPPVDRLRKFIEVKCRKDWNVCTLEDLDHLKGSMARKLFLPNFSIILEDISEGSIRIQFSVFPSLVFHLQANIQNTDLKEFLDMGIEVITVDGVVCYDVNRTSFLSLDQPQHDNLVSQMRALQKTFGKLKDDVYESVKTQPVDTFKVRLTSFDVDGQEHHLEFIEKIVDEKETIAGIWIKLNSYLNFLNYDILAHVLDKFQNEALQIRMDDYVDQITTFFRTTRLCDFVKCWPVRGKTPPVDLLRDFIEIKSCRDWNTCTLQDLDHLKGSLARKLLLPKFAFFLEKATQGSVTLVFSAHPSLIAHIQANIQNTDLKEFVDMDIEAITVDDIVCYEAPLLQYTTHLKQLYTSRSPLHTLTDSKPKHLLPFRLARIEKRTLSQGDMDRFTRDSLRGDMDDVVYKKTAMELSELGVMGDGSQPKVVLIEGAPGVGKTTFAWEQCRQWAEGKLLQAYSIVLLLPLRDNGIRQITSLSSLFQHSNDQVRYEVTRTFAENNGKGCLIWLEAWDELVDDLRTDSLFIQLIRGIQLPAATIYITSRPWATGTLLHIQQIRDRLSQHTELLGLTQEQVDIHKREISERTTHQLSTTDIPKTDLEKDFLQYIESHPVILAAMYIPVSAAIVEQVFTSISVPQDRPTTVTQLYSAYVLMRLEQYLTQHPKYSAMNIKVKTLADLPETVADDFQRLCDLAYTGVSLKTIVFSFHKDVSTLGLLQSVPQIYSEGEDQVSYNFLHYTVQEYLAALHLSHLQKQEQMTLIVTKGFRKITKYGPSYYEDAKFKTTFQFLAGITELESLPVDFLSDQLSRDAVTMYSWLYESQNLPVLRSVLGSGDRELSLPYSATTTDYFVAGYCLAHSNCTWKINCNNISVDDVAMEFLSKGIRSNHKLTATDISSKIVSASFRGGSITADGVRHFLTIPNLLLQHIKTLNLTNNNIDRRACDVLAEGVQMMPCLETLYLGHNRLIGSGGSVQLVSSLHSSKLKGLHIYDTGISDPDFESIASYIHSTESLDRLYIGFNHMSVKSIDSFCKALRANSSMRSLGIGGHHLTTSHCVCLGQLLREPIHCQIKELVLKECSMTSDGVAEVMSGLSDNHTLKELNLSENQIGSEGAIAVATMLKRNSSLETLQLDKCSIESSGGGEIGVALERNTTLKVLGLSGNTIGGDGARGLCAGLENNSSLEELVLGNDVTVGEEGVLLLLKCLEEENRSLKKLVLPKKYRKFSDIVSRLSVLQPGCMVAWA